MKLRDLLVVLVVLVMIVASAILWFRGPCWVYRFESAANIPGRCILKD